MNTRKTHIEPERLALSARDAAVLLGISRAQFWKLNASGKVPLPVRLGTKAPRWRLDELRAALKDLGWSQRAFGMKLGKSERQVSKWCAKGDENVPGYVNGYLTLVLRVQTLADETLVE